MEFIPCPNPFQRPRGTCFWYNRDIKAWWSVTNPLKTSHNKIVGKFSPTKLWPVAPHGPKMLHSELMMEFPHNIRKKNKASDQIEEHDGK